MTTKSAADRLKETAAGQTGDNVLSEASKTVAHNNDALGMVVPDTSTPSLSDQLLGSMNANITGLITRVDALESALGEAVGSIERLTRDLDDSRQRHAGLEAKLARE